MSVAADIALEEVVVSVLDAIEKGTPNSQLDGTLRRQAAIAVAARRVATSSDRAAVLRDAAALLAETLGVDHCGMCELRADGAAVSFWLCPTDAAGDTGGVQVELDNRESSSMARYAIAAGHPVVASDVLKESRFADVFLRKQRIKSAIACPVRLDVQPYGVVGVFSTQPREFTQEDVLFVESIAHLVATTIARREAETSLEERTRYQETVLEAIGAIVLELTAEGRITTFNRACQETTGFAPSEIKGRAIWSALLIPEEVGLMHGVFDRLRGGESPVEFESSILTKHGVRRRIGWSFATMPDASGNIASLIGTGIDVTRQHAAEGELARARTAAEDYRRSLDELAVQAGVEDESRRQPFERLPDAMHRDRRLRPRRLYPYVQLIAPVVDGELPGRRRFREVRCYDIAAGGFSFFTKDQPTYKKLVVAFGAAPSLTYLAAEVVHVTPIQAGGQTKYQVGCRYTDRVEY